LNGLTRFRRLPLCQGQRCCTHEYFSAFQLTILWS
jgi:hypothetical protein